MILAIVIGAAGGVLSGLLGVGGGILFVPALVLALSLSQIKSEATSLLAIVPVALVGAARQYRYGNVRLREAAVLGALSALGVLSGVALANVLPERVLRFGFAALTLFVAAHFLRRWRRAVSGAAPTVSDAEPTVSGAEPTVGGAEPTVGDAEP